MNWRALLLPVAICIATARLAGGATNELSGAQIEGRQLAWQLVQGRPTDNSNLKGVFKLRAADGKRTEVPVTFQVFLTDTNWQAIYETTPGTNGSKLVVTHDGTNANRYALNGVELTAAGADVSFAGTDFWLSDLGLEFFHWPEQRVIKKEMRRSCSCNVLESINPEPGPGRYTRVISWVDRESGGVVHAEAYAGDKQIKEFEPKSLKKVNGVWQLREVQIENISAKTRTRLEFDLDVK